VEPLTQLTLNSVEYNETLIIRWKGKPLNFSSNDKIGKFIDGLVEQFPEKIQLQPDGHTIYLHLEPGTAEALSTDEDGNMVWTELEAVTRHPPINKDGSSTLVKITTDSGRTAIATKAKSFLVGELQDDGKYKIKEKEGSELKMGDNIPIVKFLYPKENNKTFDVETILDTQDYIEKKIPSKIELTKSFGFFVGAYLAEGCTTRFQVCIANNDSDYRKKSVEWSEQFGITNRLNGRTDEIGESTTICIHSTILRNLIVKICGEGSYNKRVPDFAYSAPDEFVIGFLDAYLCGDGSFEKNGRLTAYSRSIKLRDGISLLLSRFDIHTRLFESMIVDKRDQLDPRGTSKPLYHLTTSSHEAEKMIDIVTTLKYKNDRLKRKGIVLQNKDKRNHQIQNDVMMDKVVKIEDFTSEHPFVYDLTVEKTKNMTLINGITVRDTFHAAGSASKNVTTGVPRFTELIDVSKHMKTPSVSISLDNSLKPAEVMAKMEHTTLRKIIHKFVREPLPELFKLMVETVDETGEPITMPTYRCIELNSELCIAKGITMQEIAHHMKDKIPVLHNSENSERWLMWFPKGSSVPLDMHLKGVENIEKIVMRQNIETDEWIMDTDGTNLIEVLSHPGVDWIKTTCNNVVETTEILGIEAGRQLLLREIRNVISVDGTYVNYRHISVLVDAMTYRGDLTPMSRHGINRVNDASVFHRASFEKTVSELSNAGMYAEKDPLKSITASILMGKLSESGTGFVDVVSTEPEFKFDTDTEDTDSLEGFEVGNVENKSETESEIGFELKGFDVPDYDDLYAEEEEENEICVSKNYIPSSPKVVFKTFYNYIPSSPKVQFKRISTYIPSSP
jgi:intein/homing endonuclease